MLRVSEVYLSVQGEGPRVGDPTVFVRFAGCNLRCPGWPCDTPYAIDPKLYRKEWRQASWQDLIQEIDEAAEDMQAYNVCLTGGEPFLQPEEDLFELVNALSDNVRVAEIEAFTNGTFLYPGWALQDVALVMDWKLPGSGEDHLNETRMTNLRNLTELDAVKFVIKDRNDFDVARQLYQHNWVLSDPPKPEVFYGVVWGELDNATLVDWALKAGMPWRLNVQQHNHIWHRDKRGI